MLKNSLPPQIYISGSRNKAIKRPLKEKITYSCMKIYTYTYTHLQRGALILEEQNNSYLTLLSVGAEHPATIEKVLDVEELKEILCQNYKCRVCEIM